MSISPAEATGPQANGRPAGAGRDAAWAFHAMEAAFGAGEGPCEMHFAFAGRAVRLGMLRYGQRLRWSDLLRRRAREGGQHA